MSASTIDKCPFCKKTGLAILPMRVAVARGKKDALALPQPLQQGITIPLEQDAGVYTGRLLRAGYLYVYNEARAEWKGYQVTEQGYLFEFMTTSRTLLEADAKMVAKSIMPPVSDFEFSCFNTEDEHLARCITIPNADNASYIWLGFSSAAWTWNVLKAHMDEAVREQNMQKVDVQAWINGTKAQINTLPFSQLTQAINEFVNIKRAPETTPFARLLNQGSENWVTHLMNPPQSLCVAEVRQPNSNSLEQMATRYPAFDASPFTFYGCKPHAEKFLAWGKEQEANGLPPLIVAVDDPVGIAMEINQVAVWESRAWFAEPERAWGQETTAMVNALQEVVKSGAVKQEIIGNQVGVSLAYGPQFPGDYPSAKRIEEMDKALEEVSNISPEQAKKLGEKAWQKKYTEYIDEAKFNEFNATYEAELATLQNTLIAPLDQAFTAWLDSEHMAQHLAHNFDATDIYSGIALQEVVHNILYDASDREGTFGFIKEALTQDPTDPNNYIIRAMLFNQDALIAEWQEVASKTPNKKGDFPWADNAKSLYGAIANIANAQHIGSNALFAGLSKYVRQLSGPFFAVLNSGVAAGVSFIQARLPEQHLLNLMEVMLSHDGRHLVDARGIHTRQQAAYALAMFMAQLSGDIDVKTGEVNVNKWRAAAHAQLRNLGSVGQDYQWQGLFVADEVTLKKARRLRGQQRQRVVQQGVQQTEFSILLKQNARFIASGELSAGGLGTVLTGITLTASYDEFIKAESADKTHKGMAFTGAVIAAIGEVTELTGVGLAKTPWGNTPLSKSMRIGSLVIENRAALVQGIGRLVGVAGAVILGVAQVVEGREAFKQGEYMFGLGSILLGSATAILAVIVIKLTLGAALVIALLLIAANYIVSLFKRDDIQKWLDRSLFGKQKYYEVFKDRFEQRDAFKKLAGAN